jgi:Na+/H+ antiporter NhaD/arsenite permease-like protein
LCTSSWAPVAILVFSYVAFSLGRVPWLRSDRLAAAFVGGALMVTAGGLSLEKAQLAVDGATLALLFGMMVISAALELSGAFGLVARWLTRRVQTQLGLAAAISVAAAVLSAFLINDVVCIALTPLVLAITRRLGCDPKPHLLALATASNAGSVATITGNPQNILIGSVSRISYARFSLMLAPVAVVALAINFGVLYAVHRKSLREPFAPPRVRSQASATATPVPGSTPVPASTRTPPSRPSAAGPRSARTPEAPRSLRGAEPKRTREQRELVYKRWVYKGSIVASLVVIAFLAGVPPALAALGGASVILLTRAVNPERVYKRIDFSLLALFVGLFVIVAGVERVGLGERLLHALSFMSLESTFGLTATTAIVSNVVSNVPAVMVLKSVVSHLPRQEASWLTLAMASTLAGNLTLTGSLASIIVAERAKRRCVIGFWDFARVGAPSAVLSLLAGAAWLHFVGK